MTGTISDMVLSEKYFVLNLANTNRQSRQYISLTIHGLILLLSMLGLVIWDRSPETAPGFTDPATVEKLLISFIFKVSIICFGIK